MININGKEYEVDTDPRLGVLEEYEKNPANFATIRLLLSEVLIPTPLDEDMYNIRRSDIERVLDLFQEKVEKETVEIKKKRST